MVKLSIFLFAFALSANAQEIQPKIEDLVLTGETGFSADQIGQLLHITATGNYPDQVHDSNYPDQLHDGNYPDQLHDANYPDQLHDANYPDQTHGSNFDRLRAGGEIPSPQVDL